MIQLEVGKWYGTVGLGPAKVTSQNNGYFFGKVYGHCGGHYCWTNDGRVVRGGFSFLGTIAAPSTKPWWRFWE